MTNQTNSKNSDRARRDAGQSVPRSVGRSELFLHQVFVAKLTWEISDFCTDTQERRGDKGQELKPQPPCTNQEIRHVCSRHSHTSAVLVSPLLVPVFGLLLVIRGDRTAAGGWKGRGQESRTLLKGRTSGRGQRGGERRRGVCTTEGELQRP